MTEEENLLVLATQEGRTDWLVQPIAVPNQQMDTVLMLKSVGHALATHSPKSNVVHIGNHSSRTAIGLQSRTDKTGSQSGIGTETDIEIPPTPRLQFDGGLHLRVPSQ